MKFKFGEIAGFEIGEKVKITKRIKNYKKKSKFVIVSIYDDYDHVELSNKENKIKVSIDNIKKCKTLSEKDEKFIDELLLVDEDTRKQMQTFQKFPNEFTPVENGLISIAKSIGCELKDLF